MRLCLVYAITDNHYLLKKTVVFLAVPLILPFTQLNCEVDEAVVQTLLEGCHELCLWLLSARYTNIKDDSVSTIKWASYSSGPFLWLLSDFTRNSVLGFEGLFTDNLWKACGLAEASAKYDAFVPSFYDFYVFELYFVILFGGIHLFAISKKKKQPITVIKFWRLCE